MACLVLLIVLLSSLRIFLTRAQPQVLISEGLVSGYYLKTYLNRTVSGFSGIPFAEPPIDNLRSAIFQKN